MKERQPHRGAAGDISLFAQRFLEQRFAGFMKDVEICLTGRPAEWRAGLTYAYFPALMACCGTLEYLACMFHGLRKCKDVQVAAFASQFMPQPDYNADAISLLFEGFRHKVAHHGIASGVWVDRRNHRRVTWSIGPALSAPAIQLQLDRRELIADPPWPCPVTHTATIHLRCLANDIRSSALGVQGYLSRLQASDELQANFVKCMEFMYPR